MGRSGGRVGELKGIERERGSQNFVWYYLKIIKNLKKPKPNNKIIILKPTFQNGYNEDSTFSGHCLKSSSLIPNNVISAAIARNNFMSVNHKTYIAP